MKDKRLLIIFLIVFTNLLGFGIIIPLLPFYVESMGAGVLTLGLLASAYSLFQLIAAPILGNLSDRFGRRPVLIFSILGTSLSFFMMGFAKTIFVLFLARILDGLSGGNISTAQAYIADITDKKNRSSGMGIIMAAFSLGLILGPAIGGLLSIHGYSTPFFVAGFIALLATILTILFLPETRRVSKAYKKQKLNIKTIKQILNYKNVPTLLTSSFIAMFSFAIMQSIFALFTEHNLGVDAKLNGILFTYLGILGVIVQLVLLKRILKRLIEKKVLVITSLGMAIAFLLIGASFNLVVLIIGITILSVSRGVFRPVLLGEISKSVSEDKQGNVAGLNQSVGSLARLIGPIIGALLYDYAGSRTPYFASFIFMLLMMFVIFRNLKENKAN